jgi:hypothetical protein
MQFTKQISHSKLNLKSVKKIPIYITVLNQSFDITLTHIHATTHIKFVTQHTHPTCLGIHWVIIKTRRTLQQKVWETILYDMITILLKSQLIL